MFLTLHKRKTFKSSCLDLSLTCHINNNKKNLWIENIFDYNFFLITFVMSFLAPYDLLRAYVFTVDYAKKMSMRPFVRQHDILSKSQQISINFFFLKGNRDLKVRPCSKMSKIGRKIPEIWPKEWGLQDPWNIFFRLYIQICDTDKSVWGIKKKFLKICQKLVQIWPKSGFLKASLTFSIIIDYIFGTMTHIRLIEVSN